MYKKRTKKLENKLNLQESSTDVSWFKQNQNESNKALEQWKINSALLQNKDTLLNSGTSSNEIDKIRQRLADLK